MTPQAILDVAPLVLTQQQRACYLEQGYLLVKDVVDEATLQRLKDALGELRDRGCLSQDCSTDFEFDVTEGNDTTELRQVLCSADHHPTLWSYASRPPMTDLVADVVGPNVKFMQANVSFKRPGGRGFPWHQDIAFLPCSNLSPLMVFTFLEDVTPDMGPTKLIPGSHGGERYDHYDENGNWLGKIADHEVQRIPVEKAVSVTGPAGSVLMVNCAIVHSAEPNCSTRPRPMVINGYTSGDAYCYIDMDSLYPSKYNWRIVRGEATSCLHSEEFRWKMPPDWRVHEGVRIDNLRKY